MCFTNKYAKIEHLVNISPLVVVATCFFNCNAVRQLYVCYLFSKLVSHILTSLTIFLLRKRERDRMTDKYTDKQTDSEREPFDI